MEVRKRSGLRSFALLSIPFMAILVLAWGQIVSPTVQASGTGPEMAMSVTGPSVTCSGGECDVPLGGDIMVSVEIVTAPDQGYIGVQTIVDYGADLTVQSRAEAADEFLWPDAGSDDVILRGEPGPGLISHGGLTGLIPPLPSSSYEGDLLELDLVCSDTYSQTTVRLLPFSDDRRSGAAFVRIDGTTQVEIPIKSNSVIVNCGEAPPPPLPPLPPLPNDLPPTGTYGAADSTSTGVWVLLGALLAAGVAGLASFSVRARSQHRAR